jgi:dolichyl-phosphate beta-glucosyltransferase
VTKHLFPQDTFAHNDLCRTGATHPSSVRGAARAGHDKERALKTSHETEAPPHLSIVIPAFNEAPRLPESLTLLRAYLDGRAQPYEVIVVDDGSTDGTADLAADLGAHWPQLRLIRAEHRGKGGAIRQGVLAAIGSYVMLADADFSMPAEELARFDTSALGDFDVAIGSREAKGARRIGEPAYRHLMGRVFNLIVRTLLLPGIQDTQCGFKCLRREVAQELCAHQTIEGWGFDPELLVVARRRNNTIREVPITWRYMPGSKIRPVRNTLTMISDVIRIRRNAARGRYETAAVAEPAPMHASRIVHT